MDVIEKDEATSSGKRLKLSDEIDQFVKAVMPLIAPVVADHWRTRVERIWRETERKFASKAPSTQKLYGSMFRKALGDAIDDFPDRDDAWRQWRHANVKPILATNPALLESLNMGYRADVRRRVSKLVPLTHHEKLVETFRLMLDHEDARMKAIAIMALTGRRFREVLKDGVFGPVHFLRADRVRVRERFTLGFAGQTKTRGAAGTMAGLTYKIPTLVPAAEVLAAINALRTSRFGKEALGLEDETINSRLNPQFNRLLRASLVAGFWPKKVKLSIKHLRHFYAECADAMFRPSDMFKAVFFSRILGHREDDLTASLSYMVFYIPTSEESEAAAAAEVRRIEEAARQVDGQMTEVEADDDEEDGDD